MKEIQMGSRIKVVKAREVLTNRGYPSVEAIVVTEDGSSGTAVVTAGQSVGTHEVSFVYDGGKRLGGRGVLKAVKNVNEIIAPALKGMDVTEQRKIDETMIDIDGTETKSRLGGNSTTSVSAAVLKTAAKSLDVPLYRYIGGVDACTLPVPTIPTIATGGRYGGGERSGGKPSYEFVCHGFKTLSEAIYAGWEVKNEFQKILSDRFSVYKLKNIYIPVYNFMEKALAHSLSYLTALFYKIIPKGKFESDRELWEAMTNAIANAGYEDKVGILVDVAASCYYDDKKDKFVGLISKEDKSREDLIDMYENMVATYPFVILEDPLDEEDFEGHAILTRNLGIEIVGDDLFATNIKHLKKGIEAGACNAILMKVSQIGTISEALDAVQLAYRNGYGVMPCGSRGQVVDIVDYAVGLGTGHMKGGGSGESAKRLLKIEKELGSSANFLGKDGLMPKS